MLRALWLVVAHDLLEDRYMDDVTGNSVFVLFNMAAGWKFLFDYFWLKQVKHNEPHRLSNQKNFVYQAEIGH